MSKYSEKLRDPRWQKKRLEVLESAGWECECCKSGTKTLHVHHKQYIKGREPWEYESTNFEALCEDCHADAHESKELINAILAGLPSAMWTGAASLLAGWAGDYISGTGLSERSCDAHSEEAGRLAYYVSLGEITLVPKMKEKFDELMREFLNTNTW
jgi:hypothetical protein